MAVIIMPVIRRKIAVIMTYFETKATYDKVVDDGTVKRVSEVFLMDAVSFTDAEARTIDEVSPRVNGDYLVCAVKRSKVDVVVNADAPRYYNVKYGIITVDEKTAAEKRAMVHALVGAEDFLDAVVEFQDYMKGCVADYDIVSVAESAVCGTVNVL